MKDQKKEISRREVLIGAGAAAAGAAVLSTGVAGLVSNAKASGSSYPYKKLNVDEVRKIAHETYFTKFCAETVLTGLFTPLAASVGEPYASFPLNSVFWAHGGLMGWGTACGTLIGAGMAIALITGNDKTKVTTAGGRKAVPVGEA
ncbi:MAG: C-GCAxxG-C-C family protein, partial [Deltaproteobacteria bacterium]|nr:C-GCAxxG-C-C family protein [Deltaproteobacteria bacterium]